MVSVKFSKVWQACRQGSQRHQRQCQAGKGKLCRWLTDYANTVFNENGEAYKAQITTSR